MVDVGRFITAPILISVAAFVLSCIALFTTASVARAQFYLELRKRFDEVNKKLPRRPPGPNDYHDTDWRPTPEKDTEDFKSIERYWYHTFDEWFTTKVLPRWPFRRMWTVFFERAIFEGLKNTPIRHVLYCMIVAKHTSFSGHSKEFLDDMAAVYKKYTRDKAKRTSSSGSSHGFIDSVAAEDKYRIEGEIFATFDYKAPEQSAAVVSKGEILPSAPSK